MDRFRFLLFLCCLLPSVADYSKDQHGYFMFSDFLCYLPSRNPKEVQYLIDWYFNMELTMQYNSSVGGWTGFTPAGLITAAKFNADKHDVVQRILERELVCQRSVEIIYETTETAKVEPNEVTEGVTFSDVLPNGDWTYQAHTYLTLTPGKQDHISCMVQHTSLKEPKIYNWESSKNHTENYIIGGVCALLLGAVFLCGGLIHYKLRRRSF
ncbi:boLa class II histocompatibility antigen, DQB*0101 beta chain isoform X7 [Oryzias latipes]|uniref:boLa class II histocompatibility antigen, DQB*0101 beta chain isoform X7 n=1 Tax=Oryzias latipes TaxID=8090 RepID=UPI0009D996A5|nr:boLa class II histocompatibility antigen, DQB*0101 beta chain isoform X7 [Oryzias latipes]